MGPELAMQITANIRQAEQALKRLERLNEQSAKGIRDDWKKQTDRMRQDTERNFRGIGGIAEGIGRQIRQIFSPSGLALGAGVAIVAFGKSVIDASRNMVAMRNGLKAVEGSAGAASRAMRELRDLAQLPGITLEAAARARINLRAVRLESELTNRVIKEVGNALAVAGGSADDLQGVVRAFGQIATKGKPLAEEINQIAERMPQIRTAMIDAFGPEAAANIGKMDITATAFIERVTEALSKQARATDDVNNKTSNLRNAFAEFKVVVGDVILPAFTATVVALTNALKAATPLIKEISQGQGRTLNLQDTVTRLVAGGQGDLQVVGGTPFQRATAGQRPVVINLDTGQVQTAVQAQITPPRGSRPFDRQLPFIPPRTQPVRPITSFRELESREIQRRFGFTPIQRPTQAPGFPQDVGNIFGPAGITLGRNVMGPRQLDPRGVLGPPGGMGLDVAGLRRAGITPPITGAFGVRAGVVSPQRRAFLARPPGLGGMAQRTSVQDLGGLPDMGIHRSIQEQQRETQRLNQVYAQAAQQTRVLGQTVASVFAGIGQVTEDTTLQIAGAITAMLTDILATLQARNVAGLGDVGNSPFGTALPIIGAVAAAGITVMGILRNEREKNRADDKRAPVRNFAF